MYGRYLLMLLAPIVVASRILSQDAVANAEARATAASERTIAVAWEAYAVENNTYLPFDKNPGLTSRGRGPGQDVRWSNYVELTYDQLKSFLQPIYIRDLPRQDGWGRPFEFAVRLADGGADQYVIRSLGADGEEDHEGNYSPGRTTSLASDIVLADGEFVRLPSDAVLSSTTSIAAPPAEEDGPKRSKIWLEAAARSTNDWTPVSWTDDEQKPYVMFSFHRSRFERSGDKLLCWIRTDVVPSATVSSRKAVYTYSVSRVEVHCSKGQYRDISAANYYDSAGRVVHTGAAPKFAWVDAVPDSLMDEFVVSACAATEPPPLP